MLTQARSVIVTNVTTEAPVVQIESVALHQVKLERQWSSATTDLYGVIATNVTTKEPVVQIEAVALHQKKHSYSSIITRVESDKVALAALLNQSNVGTDDVLIDNMFNIVEWSDVPLDGKDTQITIEATPAAPFIGDMTLGYNRIKVIDLKPEYGMRNYLNCSDYIKSNLVEGWVLQPGVNKLPLKESMIFAKDSYVHVEIKEPTKSLVIDFKDAVRASNQITTTSGHTFTSLTNVELVEDGLVFAKLGGGANILLRSPEFDDVMDEVIFDITINEIQDISKTYGKIFSVSTSYGPGNLYVLASDNKIAFRPVITNDPFDVYFSKLPNSLNVGDRVNLRMFYKDTVPEIRTDDQVSSIVSPSISVGKTPFQNIGVRFGTTNQNEEGMGFTLHSIQFNGY